ncbi:MAG: hypothetical protein DCF31_09740 [Alphaproteobacteria bacterium]|nr:MAG: hypothetical protein DCF31_09740 [Alphaproteobacteria bacterium]
MTASARPKRAQRPVREARQARSRATVDAILEAAARVLVARGWEGLNTNVVAEVAGVSIGSLYEYFRDKEALLASLHDRHLARGEALVAEVAARGLSGSAEDVSALLVNGFVTLHRDNPKLHRVLSAEVPVSRGVRRRVAALNGAIVQLVAAGLSGRVPDPELSARLLVDTADALTHRWIVEPGGKPISSERIAGELTSMFSAYLGAVAPELEDRQHAGEIVGPRRHRRACAQRLPGGSGAFGAQGGEAIGGAGERDPGRWGEGLPGKLGPGRVVEADHRAPAFVRGDGGDHRFEIEKAIGDVDEEQAIGCEGAAIDAKGLAGDEVERDGIG